MIDVARNTYRLMAQLSGGSEVDLTPAVEEMNYGYAQGELAQRASITLARLKLSDGRYVNEVMALCTKIQIFANDVLRFKGIVWEWEYESDKSRVISVTAYDKLIYAQKHKENFFCKKGHGTKKLIEHICKKQNIEVAYEWLTSFVHGKQMHRGATIADQMLTILEKVRLRTTSKYVALMIHETLHVRHPGMNRDVYVFRSGESLMGVSHKCSMDNLVTRVIITGKEKNGKVPVKATLDGDTSFGIIQEIVSQGNLSQAAAKLEAQTILEERGKPEDTIRISAPDVPDIVKGDRIKVVGGTLDGYFIVLSIQHDARSKSMAVELEKDK